MKSKLAPLLIAIASSFLLVGCRKQSGDLTKRDSIALTNALRVVSTKAINSVGFSDVDNRVFVQTGFVTNKNGHTERDGYVFERGLSGWHLVAKPRGSLNF
jgi:uncharacterized lipoprotein YajG